MQTHFIALSSLSAYVWNVCTWRMNDIFFPFLKQLHICWMCWGGNHGSKWCYFFSPVVVVFRFCNYVSYWLKMKLALGNFMWVKPVLSLHVLSIPTITSESNQEILLVFFPYVRSSGFLLKHLIHILRYKYIIHVRTYFCTK